MTCEGNEIVCNDINRDCWNNCEDGSDEGNCPEDSCLPCDDGNGVYNSDWMCNAYSDCADGTDELDCFVCDSYYSLGCESYEPFLIQKTTKRLL